MRCSPKVDINHQHCARELDYTLLCWLPVKLFPKHLRTAPLQREAFLDVRARVSLSRISPSIVHTRRGDRPFRRVFWNEKESIPTEGIRELKFSCATTGERNRAYLSSAMASQESAEPVINASLAIQIATSEGEASVDPTSVNTI